MIHKSINACDTNVTTIADTIIALQIMASIKHKIRTNTPKKKINVHSSHQTTTIVFLSNIKKYILRDQNPIVTQYEDFSLSFFITFSTTTIIIIFEHFQQQKNTRTKQRPKNLSFLTLSSNCNFNT